MRGFLMLSILLFIIKLKTVSKSEGFFISRSIRSKTWRSLSESIVSGGGGDDGGSGDDSADGEVREGGAAEGGDSPPKVGEGEVNGGCPLVGGRCWAEGRGAWPGG